ncbi:MAG: hypothetical protein SGPRY_009770 [Prymnesium sp.]
MGQEFWQKSSLSIEEPKSHFRFETVLSRDFPDNFRFETVMSSRQVDQFSRLFAAAHHSAFQAAIEGRLRDSAVRSIAWRFFLGSLPLPFARWPTLAREANERYHSLCAEHCTAPSEAAESLDPTIANPLSQHAASPWRSLFASSELRDQICVDLDRLGGDAFFEEGNVKEQMLRILFVWARLHPRISYRQGMHELLAPILLICTNDAKEASGEATTECREKKEREGRWGEGREDDGSDSSEVLRSLLRMDGVEGAAFEAFSALMASMACWFAPGGREQVGRACLRGW